MKRLISTLFVFWLSSQLCGAIQLRVCNPNTLQPLELEEVMMGTTVSILVQSDANDLWGGGVFIEGNNRKQGLLTARRSDPNSFNWDSSDPNLFHFNWDKSCLPAAGPKAYVLGWKDSNIWGFDCYTDDLERQPGNWFVLDYTPLRPGLCTVSFYDHNESWADADPNLTFDIHNTPTRDLNPDDVVNLADFVLFAADWNTISDPNDPNTISPSDFDGDGYVGLTDALLFSDYWLYGTPGWEPAEETAEPGIAPEPSIACDVTFSLICDPNASPFTDPNTLSDANSLSEITLQVGDSVVIYLDKSSTYEEVRVIDMDVLISDPNLGTINNGQLLVWPRMTFFDYVGAPDQGTGIGFLAANLDTMTDGDMACFVYTATERGEVTLNLANYITAPAAELKPMVIHQVVPVVELLQQAYSESPDLQQSVSPEEWNEFIDSVQESTQLSN